MGFSQPWRLSPAKGFLLSCPRIQPFSHGRHGSRSRSRGHGGAMTAATQEVAGLPDIKVSVRQLFGFDSDMEVPAYSEADDHVPDTDEDYRFDKATTLAILAGFAHNRRVIISGYHGTGKSTHVEQVAARLNWPCVRVNLDSHISRIDLIGKDAIVIKDG